MRISQVAFSADEEFLVLSAEVGGGLAVYEVQSLLQGNQQAAFEIGTNGTALRHLLPNPVPGEHSGLFAAVTVKGELIMADLKKRNVVTGRQGPIFKSNVSSVAWSRRGKQIMAGLADGSACQLTPEGEEKAEIQKPPSLSGDQHSKPRI